MRSLQYCDFSVVAGEFSRGRLAAQEQELRLVVGVSRPGTRRIRLIAAVAWPNCLRGGELCGMTGLGSC